MFEAEQVKETFEFILLLGAGLMAIYTGLKRIYKSARSIETILDHVIEDKKERDIINKALNDHIKMEADRDAIRDVQLIEITNDLREITREVRPNGGSSMKDSLTNIANDIGHVKERLASVEQWKKDNQG